MALRKKKSLPTQVVFAPSTNIVGYPFPSGQGGGDVILKAVIHDIIDTIVKQKEPRLYGCLEWDPKASSTDMGYFLTEYGKAIGRHKESWKRCGTCPTIIREGVNLIPDPKEIELFDKKNDDDKKDEDKDKLQFHQNVCWYLL